VDLENRRASNWNDDAKRFDGCVRISEFDWERRYDSSYILEWSRRHGMKASRVNKIINARDEQFRAAARKISAAC
jgi:hypothetical protein